jgi:hypothetical protein
MRAAGRQFVSLCGSTRFVRNRAAPRTGNLKAVRTWCAVRFWVVRPLATTRRRRLDRRHYCKDQRGRRGEHRPVAGTWPATIAFRSSAITSSIGGIARESAEAIRCRRGHRRNRTGNFAMLAAIRRAQ